VLADRVLLSAGVRTVNDRELIWREAGREPELVPPRFERGAKVGSGLVVLAIGNDVTARDMAFKDMALHLMFSQITRAKGMQTGAPVGSWLVTTDEVTDPHDLDQRCGLTASFGSRATATR
jgi:fumarylacetoacetate (FAA) hydrolase family protein